MQVFKLIQTGRTEDGNLKVDQKQELESPEGQEASTAASTEDQTPVADKQLEGVPGAEEKLKEAGLIAEDEKTEGSVAYLKVDGPVGRVFTNALNAIFARESYMTFSPLDLAVYPDQLESEDKKARKIFVYALKSDDVKLSDIVHLGDEMAKHDDNMFVIALESASKKFSDASGHLLEIAKRSNVKLCYSSEAAVDHVKDLMK